MILSFELVNPYIALVAVLVNLTLAAWVILRSTRNLIYITFMFLCFSLAFWHFSDFMIYATGENPWLPIRGQMPHPSLWKYYGTTGSALAVAFLFHFMCSMVKGGRRQYGWIFLCYVIAGFFGVTSPMAVYYQPVRSFVDGIAWNVMFGLTLIPFIIAGFIMLTVSMVRAETRDEKNRWLFTMIAIAIAFGGGLTDLVQKLNVPVPPLGAVGSVIGPSILAVGIFRHRRVFDILTRARVKLGAMSEMAAGISHEIRNPLTAIRSAAGLQAEELNRENWEEAGKYQKIIADEIQRLDGILSSFRDFTRPISLQKELRSINEIVERTVSMARMEELGIDIEPELSGDIPRCEVDPALLRQVFINFILNASEACGPGGLLHISTKWQEPWVVISFKDNGPGVPPGVSGRLFEPFVTTKPEGVGIGLAICKRIIDAHDGRVEVVGNDSKGAHFRIRIRGPR